MSKAYHIVVDGRIIGTGTGNYLNRTLDELQKLDTTNNYTIILNQKGANFWQPKAQNFKVYITDIKNFSLSEQTKLPQQIKALKPDLVHFAFQVSPFLYRGAKIFSVLDLTQLRFLNSVQQNPFKQKLRTLKQKLLAANIKYSINSADHILTISNYVRKELIKKYKIADDRISTTHNAADPITSNKPVPVLELEGKDYICYVGTAFEHKNLRTLIEGFKILKQTHPNLNLAFAGRKDAFYEALANDYSNVPDIHFLGFISDEQLVWLYQHARAYVFPSFSEGFGLPSLEAMRYSCPVASSDATCLPEINGKAAVYFNPSSAEDLREAVDRILNDAELRTNLIKLGKEQVAKYSWKKCAQETLDVYKTVLSAIK